MIDFFSKEDEKRIIRKIKEAESLTSGEIRVHLERTLDDLPVLEVAAQVFELLEMHQTDQRNGVLILLIPEEKQFAILGDQGINSKVPVNFWDQTRDKMQTEFRKGAFADGLCTGIECIGQKLKEFFPYQKDDKNELPDDISYGR